MRTLPEQNWEAIEFEGDNRWELVQRVIESPHLIGSARLRDFLLHVTACAIRETPEDATEQQIGIRVFQRSPGFNSSEDSIVRSQARLLRLKLSAYFNTEGASEPMIIEIPKGHYLPVFSPSQRVKIAEEVAGEGSIKVTLASIPIEEVKDAPLFGRAGAAGSKRERGWLALAGVGLALLLCLSLVMTFRWQRQGAAVAKPIKQLWAPFLAGDPPLVIYSNALFVGDAKSGMRYAANDGSDGQSTEFVDHYTGIGELISVHELTRMFDYQRAEFVLKRSPLVTWDEARSRNLIFIGSIAENGSLKLLPSTQDFTLTATADAAGIINHHPGPGEPQVYLRPEHPLTKDYAIVALLPGVQPDYKMFVFSGLTTLGTQAAVEYALEPDTAAELIRQVSFDKKIHNFEALLEVSIRGGVPLQPRLVSLRVH
ncbi:MAG TPA: hypothetical protein VK638_28735 [Edaphobacter sp.]|nr:hypothetical protein [Edaphobacter sp.]